MFESSQIMAKDQILSLDLTFDHYLAGLRYFILVSFLTTQKSKFNISNETGRCFPPYVLKLSLSFLGV
jgi:hypothetical protein